MRGLLERGIEIFHAFGGAEVGHARLDALDVGVGIGVRVVNQAQPVGEAFGERREEGFHVQPEPEVLLFEAVAPWLGCLVLVCQPRLQLVAACAGHDDHRREMVMACCSCHSLGHRTEFVAQHGERSGSRRGVHTGGRGGKEERQRKSYDHELREFWKRIFGSIATSPCLHCRGT